MDSVKNIGFTYNTPKIGTTSASSGGQLLTASKPDEFVKEGGDKKEEKKGLSTKQKVGIASGIGVAATIAFLIYKGRTSEAKKLAESIEFKPAQTIEEAIAFGKKHLGIKSYSGFEQGDLEVINWLNEGFVNCSNRMKGKLRMPKNIVYGSGDDWNFIAGAVTGGKYSGWFGLNKSFWSNIDKEIEKVMHGLQQRGWLDVNEGKLTLPEKICSPEMIKEFIAHYESYKKATSFKDKVLFYEISERLRNSIYSLKTSPMRYIRQIFSKSGMKIRYKDTVLELEDIEKLSTEKQFEIWASCLRNPNNNLILGFNLATSPFNTIYHEMGHIQDMRPRCLAAGKFSDASKYPEELKEWLGNEEYMQIAHSVSSYASSGPGEFIAETFAALMEGRKLDEAVINLYKKLGGPSIPNM